MFAAKFAFAADITSDDISTNDMSADDSCLALISLFYFCRTSPRFEPGTAWWEALMLPLCLVCYSAPPKALPDLRGPQIFRQDDALPHLLLVLRQLLLDHVPVLDHLHRVVASDACVEYF